MNETVHTQLLMALILDLLGVKTAVYVYVRFVTNMEQDVLQNSFKVSYLAKMYLV